MNENYIKKLLALYFISTPDGRLIGDKENRFNPYEFSYTGPSGFKYTSPRRLIWPSGSYGRRNDILEDRIKALQKQNKPISEILSINYNYGFEFRLDQEVIIVNDHYLWLECLKKQGLDYSSIPEFEKKYKKKVLEKNYFKNAIDKRYHRLDLYDPTRHLNIEHDGSWCHIPELDAARDEFLHIKFPDLIIERIIDFDLKKKPECKEILLNIFNKYSEPKYKDPLVFRYDDFVISQQFSENEDAIRFIIDCVNKGFDLSQITEKLAIELNRFKNNSKNV